MQISNEIIKVLEYLCGEIGATIDWTNSNVLPYIEQLFVNFINFEIATSLVWLTIGILCAIVGFYFIKPAKEKWEKSNNDCFDEHIGLCILYWIIFGFLTTIAIFVVTTQIFDIIECYVFPEKTIFDYIQPHIGNIN